MHIRRLTIRNYRGLSDFTWDPKPGVNCLIGPGDSGKSTVLAAISLLLAPYPAGPCSEFDYYGRRVGNGFEITAVINVPDPRLLATDRFPPLLQGWRNGEVTPLPDEDGAEPVIVVRVRGTPDMEALHEIVPPTEAVECPPFSVALRRRFALARLSGEDRAPRDLRVGPGSLLDKYLGRTDFRPALHQAVAVASRSLELPTSVQEGVASMAALFERANLPTDLHLGIVPPAGGTTLPGMVTLLHGADPAEAIPIALSGTGTRHLALLELSSALALEQPVIVVDEPERGLEPYRQRLAAERIVELSGERGHAFLTTHAPAVLSRMPAGSVWRMGPSTEIVALDSPDLHKVLATDPEALLCPLPVFCEGPTEIGLLSVVLPPLLGGSLDRLGIHLIDGRGQPQVFGRVEAFAAAGLRCAAFLDNEAAFPEKRARLSAGCHLFVWEDACNIEEAVAQWLPEERLVDVPAWAAEARDGRERSYVDQVRGRFSQPAGRTIGELIDEFGARAVRQALAACMSNNTWFKTVDAGRLLGQRLLDVGLPEAIRRQVEPFAAALRGTT
ncbi:AAA family ATPase [Microvirga sp. SYSU G3D207]|uniref:AAA family ATPase n=2 Tax=Microvirga arsenatis TaxID=2692265 RepID=A0ABW9YTT1_9HYPH|nr:AAA family ATPase [Microvirga arsenatis]NBJ23656.1 AAA family ATPase [Microvirga arsenatis]